VLQFFVFAQTDRQTGNFLSSDPQSVPLHKVVRQQSQPAVEARHRPVPKRSESIDSEMGDRERIPEKARQILDGAMEGSAVAVVTFVGTLCPVTIAHIQCVTETQAILMQLPTSSPPVAERPRNLGRPDVTIGLVSVNPDSYVRSKFRQSGQVAISAADRHMLVELALQDLPHVSVCYDAWSLYDQLERSYPHLRLTQFEVDGADVAIKYQKWNHATLRHRFVAICRKDDDGSTQQLLSQVHRDRVDLDAGLFILGPELPDISSTRVRAACMAGDRATLQTMLHPAVMEWNLTHGPYAPKNGPPPPAATAVPLKTQPHTSVSSSNSTTTAAAAAGSLPTDLAAPKQQRKAKVFRNCEPYATRLRNTPTTSRTGDVWARPNTVVLDGEEVCVLSQDASGEFTFVRANNSVEGWVQSQYVSQDELQDESKARKTATVLRNTHPFSTLLRNTPTTERTANVWSLPPTEVQDNEQVHVLRQDSSGAFTYIRTNNGVEGWIRTKYISSRLEQQPLAKAKVFRNCVPYATRLRNTPTTCRTGDVWARPYTDVADGEEVCVLDHKDTSDGAFTFVRASLGVAGWIRSEYLK
jgi:hypothetical protein